MIGTIVIHSGGNVHHRSNSCVHFSRGTTMIVGSSGAPHNAHVFKPMTERLHRGSFVGVISLTPRMLWRKKARRVTGLRVGGNSAIIIVSNGSGNGRNAIVTARPGGRHMFIRNIGAMGHRAGPSRTGPRNNVIAGRTNVRISGMVIISPRAGATAHVGGMRNGSNGFIHTAIGSNAMLGWSKGRRLRGYLIYLGGAALGSGEMYGGGSGATVW